MTEVLDPVNVEYESSHGRFKETVVVPDRHSIPPDVSVPGLRFHYLLLQLRERGWTQTKIAGAISLHQTYVSDWQKADFGGRKGIGADIIAHCMSGPLKLHYDYFFADYEKLPVPEERRQRIELADGTSRPCRPGEADAQLFPVDIERARSTRTAREVEELRRESKELRADNAALRADFRALQGTVAELLAELRGARKASSNR